MTTIEDVKRITAARRDRGRWILRMKIAGIIMIIISAFGIVGAFDMRAEEAATNPPATVASSPFDKGGLGGFQQRLAAARELERGLRGCPPAGPGMTDVVVMVVRYESDIVPTVEHCMRFAERSYLPRRAR